MLLALLILLLLHLPPLVFIHISIPAFIPPVTVPDTNCGISYTCFLFSNISVAAGNEIQCFDCNSWEDSRCHDPWNWTYPKVTSSWSCHHVPPSVPHASHLTLQWLLCQDCPVHWHWTLPGKQCQMLTCTRLLNLPFIMLLYCLYNTCNWHYFGELYIRWLLKFLKVGSILLNSRSLLAVIYLKVVGAQNH